MSKLIKCKACGNEIAAGAKCPKCGHDSRSFFSKHKIITGILIIIVLAVIAGALNSKDDPKKVGENKSSAANVTKTDDKKDEGSKSFKVGDIVEIKDFKFTVNKVYTVTPKDDFSKPKDGNEFIAVDCTIENTSKAEQAISSMAMFKVVDKDGRQCEYSMTGLAAASAGQLDGTVGAGRKLTGVYVVEVKKGTTGLDLEFNSSFVLGKQVVVKLN